MNYVKEEEDFLFNWMVTLTSMRAPKVKQKILALEDKYDTCRITMSSTVLDMQDILTSDVDWPFERKRHFLEKFTVTGIPIYKTTSSQELLQKPWMLNIANFVPPTYKILSQTARETYLQQREVFYFNDDDDTVWLDDTQTRFNTIVPVFAKDHVLAMTPLMKTWIYSLAVTFALTRLPNVPPMDSELHLAALGVTWIRLLNFPSSEYLEQQLMNIEKTAGVYLKNYGEYNLSDLWTLIVRGDQLVKPLFFLNHFRRRFTTKEKKKILEMTRQEYIRRCVLNKQYPISYLCDRYKKHNHAILSKSVTKAVQKARLGRHMARQVMLAEMNNSSNDAYLCTDFNHTDLERSCRSSDNIGDIRWCALENLSVRLLPKKEEKQIRYVFSTEYIHRDVSEVLNHHYDLKYALRVEYLDITSDAIYHQCQLRKHIYEE